MTPFSLTEYRKLHVQRYNDMKWSTNQNPFEGSAEDAVTFFQQYGFPAGCPVPRSVPKDAHMLRIAPCGVRAAHCSPCFVHKHSVSAGRT